MKKSITAFLAVISILAMAGCSKQPVTGSSSFSVQSESTQSTKSENTQSSESSQDTESEVSSEYNSETPESSDIETVSDSSLENPAKLNQWVACEKYNYKTKKDETIFVRVKKVVRGKEALDLIDEYNSSATVPVKLKDVESLEPCVAIYDIMFPSTWKMSEYGTSNPEISNFNVCGRDGKSVRSDGAFLITSSINITPRDYDKRYFSGDTFTDGKRFFYMFENVDDYLLEIGSKNKTYISVK